MSHGPIDARYRAQMNAIAEGLDEILNGKDYRKTGRKLGFALLIYPFGETPSQERINYIGNGQREEVLTALKELVARWEGRVPPTTGGTQ